MDQPKILVVGSINMDLFVKGAHPMVKPSDAANTVLLPVEKDPITPLQLPV